MESRPSRFDVDSSGKPLKASVLPPTTMITGLVTIATLLFDIINFSFVNIPSCASLSSTNYDI
jgi:hypothetical protein